MALGPRLDLRQSQSLVMTPQLQQAIKLLALSNLELEAYLAEALEGNPLLDASPADRDDGGPDEGGDDAPGRSPYRGRCSFRLPPGPSPRCLKPPRPSASPPSIASRP